MAGRLLFKLQCGGDLRRWTLEGPPEALTWTALHEKLRELFGDAADEAALQYTDADGDRVTLGCQSDVVELLRQRLEVVYLTVAVKDKAKDKEKTRPEAKEKGKLEAKEKGKLEKREEIKEKRGKEKEKLDRKEKLSSDEESGGKWPDGKLDRWLAKLLSHLKCLEEGAGPNEGERHLHKVLRMLEKAGSHVDPAGRSKIIGEVAARLQEAPSIRARALPHIPLGSFAEEVFAPPPPGGVVAHPGVACDGCNMQPLLGKRYKSLSRYDFDVCEACKAQPDKPWTHDQFMCIERPCNWRGAMGPASFFDPRRGPAPSLIPPPFGGAGPFGRGGPGAMGRGPCGFWGRGGGRFGRSGGGGCPAFEGWCHQPGMAGADGHRCKREGASRLEARFVADVNVFDGTQVTPEQQFIKIWRLRNSGSAPWPEGCSLLNVGGDDIGATAVSPLQLQAEGLAPGSELDIAVECRAPAEPGRYVSYFRLQEPSGARFGQRVWCMVQVVGPDSEPAQTVPAEEGVQREEGGSPAASELPPQPAAAEQAASEAPHEAAPPAPLAEAAEEQAAVAVAVEAPVAPEEEPLVAPQFLQALQELDAMGFKDVAVNQRLLSLYGSDISKAVAELLLSSNGAAELAAPAAPSSSEAEAAAPSATNELEEWGLLSAEELGLSADERAYHGSVSGV